MVAASASPTGPRRRRAVWRRGNAGTVGLAQFLGVCAEARAIVALHAGPATPTPPRAARSFCAPGARPEPSWGVYLLTRHIGVLHPEASARFSTTTSQMPVHAVAYHTVTREVGEWL